MNHTKFLNYVTWILVMVIIFPLLLPHLLVSQLIGPYVLVIAPLAAAVVLFIYYQQVSHHLNSVDSKRYVWSIVAWAALGTLGVIGWLLG
ncbi:MAG: hypothetical protein H5T98_10365 [Syntrophomonadaceae bacterium]|nr:hypothetical protein [Syntrophomonadaceae bacterium]